MSLQSLTRSPFRVVDEINQGMDPRNERLVHARMVAIATGNDEWQAEYERETAESRVTRLNRQSQGGNNEDDGEHAGGSDADEVLADGMADDEEMGKGDAAVGSQYFLITPKLLHDLRYEPGMRVLCIASGEHMPSEPEKMSFEKSLAIRRSAVGRAR